MPKENIDDCVIKGFRAEVTWSPAGHVQVASVNTASTLTLTGDEPGDEPEPFDGWRITLDRGGINRLIRSLRRARDQAFGRDE